MSHSPEIPARPFRTQGPDAKHEPFARAFRRLLPSEDPALGARPARLARTLGQALSDGSGGALSDLAQLLAGLLAPQPLGSVMDHPAAVDALLAPHMALAPEEHFAVIGCDAGLGLLGYELVARGLVNRCPIHLRQLAEPLLRWGASTYVLAHNHPSGCPLPSEEDWSLTEAVKPKLAMLGLRCLDHVIIARRGYASLFDGGEVQLRPPPWEAPRIVLAGPSSARYGAPP